jgi:hypothetical protein
LSVASCESPAACYGEVANAVSEVAIQLRAVVVPRLNVPSEAASSGRRDQKVAAARAAEREIAAAFFVFTENPCLS